MPDPNCVFCKIVAGEIPSKKEFEDEEVVVIHDINPKAPVHLLVIPRKHIAKLLDASETDKSVLGKCQLVAAQVARKLGIEAAFRVLLASGEGAGQTVFHIHYHVIGGWDKQPPLEVGKEFP